MGSRQHVLDQKFDRKVMEYTGLATKDTDIKNKIGGASIGVGYCACGILSCMSIVPLRPSKNVVAGGCYHGDGVTILVYCIPIPIV